MNFIQNCLCCLSQGYVNTQMKLLRINSVGFDVTDQLLIRFSTFVRYWRKNGSTMRQYISYSYTSKKPTIQ
jgi:hypothetical protein